MHISMYVFYKMYANTHDGCKYLSFGIFQLDTRIFPTVILCIYMIKNLAIGTLFSEYFVRNAIFLL